MVLEKVRKFIILNFMDLMGININDSNFQLMLRLSAILILVQMKYVSHNIHLEWKNFLYRTTFIRFRFLVGRQFQLFIVMACFHLWKTVLSLHLIFPLTYLTFV